MRPDLLARHIDAVTVARRRERALWLWTIAAAVFGWAVILAVACAALILL